MLDKFYATPQADRSKLAIRFFFTHDGKPAVDVHFFLVVNGKRSPMIINPDGQVQRLPTAPELAAHSQIAVEAKPEYKFGARLSLDTSIKPAQEISAAECDLAVNQANAVIRRAAGVMAMMAPKVKAVTFIGSGSGTALTTEGAAIPLLLIKGAPAYDPEALKNAKTIRLSKTPTLVSLE